MKDRPGFITSFGNESTDQNRTFNWFNIWKTRQPPYTELRKGDTLFWYSPQDEAILLETLVTDVYQCPYNNQQQLKKMLEDHEIDNPSNDPYFTDRAPGGRYCLAFKVKRINEVFIPKPMDFAFARNGWMSCDDVNAQRWLSTTRVTGVQDDELTQVHKIAKKLKLSGYFEPRTLVDDRETTLCEVLQRRGQPEFREELISAYGGRCAVTGCDALAALEAAHIVPYSGPKSNHVSNGLLLRADIHTLFDLNLLRIHPKQLTVVLDDSLKGSSYSRLHGKKCSTPKDVVAGPSEAALLKRWKRHQIDDSETP